MAMLVFQYKPGLTPDPPSNMMATAGDGQVTVSWDAVTGADNYTVYFSTSPGVTTGDSTVPGSPTASTSIVHTGLSNGTTYYYKAVATSTLYGTSGLSNEVSDTPAASVAWTFSGTETFDTGQTFDTSSENTQGFNVIELSHDGLHAYTGDPVGNVPTVYQYDLTVAWDLTTMSYASKSLGIDVDPGTGFSNFSGGIVFKPDGTNIYVNAGDDEVENKIVQYSLSTAWDVSTGSFVNRYNTPNLGGAFPAGTNGLYIDPTGTYVYMAVGGNQIRRATMSTPWALSSISSFATTTNTYTVSGVGSYIADVSLDPTGTKIFISDHSGNFYEDQLSVAWDLTTASSTGRHTYNPTQTTGAGHLCWKWDDGKKFFAMDAPFGSSQDLSRYTIT